MRMSFGKRPLISSVKTAIMQASFFGIMLLLISKQSRADLIFNVDSASFKSGGLGYVDVFVESNGSDTFTLFNYKFEISPVSVIHGGVLEFRDSFSSANPIRQSNSEQAEANYIFSGMTSIDNFSAARQNPNRLQLVGGDYESSMTPITITAGNSYLLARLELQHITPTPSLSTGSFRISLVQDPAQTYFQNVDLDELDPGQPMIASISYTNANSGIIGITAVPEPSSISLLGITIGIAKLMRRRMRRKD